MNSEILVTKENIDDLFKKIKEQLMKPEISPIQDRIVYTGKIKQAIEICEKYANHSRHVEDDGLPVATQIRYLTVTESNFTLEKEYFDKNKKFISFKLGEYGNPSTIEIGDTVFFRKIGIFIKKEESVDDTTKCSFNMWKFFRAHKNSGFLENPSHEHPFAFFD